MIRSRCDTVCLCNVSVCICRVTLPTLGGSGRPWWQTSRWWAPRRRTGCGWRSSRRPPEADKRARQRQKEVSSSRRRLCIGNRYTLYGWVRCFHRILLTSHPSFTLACCRYFLADKFKTYARSYYSRKCRSSQVTDVRFVWWNLSPDAKSSWCERILATDNLVVQSRAKISGTTRYFRTASTWNGRLCRLTWPGWT